MSTNNLLVFKESAGAIKVVVMPHAKYQTEMHLGLSLENIKLLHETFDQMLQSESHEIRVPLPVQSFGTYILYFKTSDKQNRIQIARPELSKWIGSLILNSDAVLFIKNQLESLMALASSEFRFSSCGNLYSMCNFDLRLYRL